MDNDIYYNLEEASSKMKISTQTLTNWVKSNKIDCFKTPSSQYLFKKDYIDDYENTIFTKIESE